MRVWLKAVLTVSVVFSTACARKDQQAAPNASLKSGGVHTETPIPKAVSTAKWTHHSEEEWLVSEIAQGVSDMLLLAKDPALLHPLGERPTPSASRAAGAAYPFSVALDSGGRRLDYTVTIRDHAWSPTTYEDFARTLADQLQLRPTTRRVAKGPSPLRTLLDLKAVVIERENQRISALLRRDMLNPEAHEWAALLLGALSLREGPGTFADSRQQLCRLAAHLTMAGALRGSSPPGIEGEYAAALLDTLVGRERRATAQIERLSKNGQKTSAELAWLNALTLRNTGDWRILKNPSRATLLERLEYFRALGKHQGGLKALDFLGRRPGEPLPDWGRIALGVRSPTVEEGNVFVPTLMNLEMAELATILKASQGRELKPESLVVELNVSPGRSVWPAGSTVPEPRVIDWGTWAAYSQRHVLGALSNTERYLVHCLGALEQGGDFRRETTDHFASLSLFPLLGAVWESRVIPKVGSTPQPGYQDVGRCPAVVAVAQSRPEVITAANWGELASKCWQASRDGSLPGPSAWFQPAVPRGTTFDVRNRYFVADLLKVFNTEIEALVELAPYEPLLVSHLISVKYADKPNPEQFAAAWGRLSEYDANVVQRRLKMVTPDKDAVVELAKKACQSNPDECLGAGDKLRERGFEEAAVAVYERAVALAHDRVAVSNSCRWLVQYYFDHGKTEKAVTVAHMVGAVYSAEGLETLGQVLERMGKYDDAEKVYKALVERYPNTPATLLSFYIRHEHRVADGRFRGQAADAIKQLFPGPWGMRQVTLTDLKKSPFSNTGVSVMWARELQAAGAVPDDTVLAVDGYRVTTQGQYECVMSLADGPEITLLVFRNKAYVEIKGHVDRWHFGPSTEVRAAS